MKQTEMHQRSQHKPVFNQKLRILVLDNSDFDLQKLSRLIKRGNDNLEVICCSRPEQFARELSAKGIDICLVDHQLAGRSGLEVVRHMKSDRQTSKVPVIMVSGREDPKSVVQSMKAGCVGYLGKGSLTVERLHASIFDAISSTFSDPKQANQVREATGDVICGVAAGCIKELKPRLGDIYRQIAFIRACESKGLHPSPETFDDVEAQCLTIWRFFDEIENYSQTLSKSYH